MWTGSMPMKPLWGRSMRFSRRKDILLPGRKTDELQLAKRKPRPVIDISYVELPERVTHRINLSSILGTISFFSMLFAPAAVEGESYILALALVAACGICAHLAIREEGKRR